MSLIKIRAALLLAVILALAFAGCTIGTSSARVAHENHLFSGLSNEQRFLNAAARMDASLDSLRRVRSGEAVRKLDYLPPRERDAAELALAEYLASRDELSRIAILNRFSTDSGELGRRAAHKRRRS